MHTFYVILNLCVINGLYTKCIDSVVRLHANISCNLLNILPYAGSLRVGCLTLHVVKVVNQCDWMDTRIGQFRA